SRSSQQSSEPAPPNSSRTALLLLKCCCGLLADKRREIPERRERDRRDSALNGRERKTVAANPEQRVRRSKAARRRSRVQPSVNQGRTEPKRQDTTRRHEREEFQQESSTKSVLSPMLLVGGPLIRCLDQNADSAGPGEQRKQFCARDGIYPHRHRPCGRQHPRLARSAALWHICTTVDGNDRVGTVSGWLSV